MSTPLATLLANSPICRLPMLAACSTTSRPRNTSPSASGRVLPCSAVSRAASSLMFSRISCWYLRKTRERVPIGVLRQVLKACLALATAAFISSAVAKGTRARTSWVAGLTTSRHWVLRDSTNSPLMRSLTLGMLEEVIFSSAYFLWVELSHSAWMAERSDLDSEGPAYRPGFSP
ncbi:hypothetical protein D3C78_1411090 [compost metagenome]